MELVIVTGMSGAGKSTALRILEDLGYYSMDNLPVKLISDFISLNKDLDPCIDKVAIGMDIRGIGFNKILEELEAIKDLVGDVKILFLDAEDDVIVKRYKERRRPHPLEKEGSILAGISKEREKISDINKFSDYIIDTSALKVADLKTRLVRIFSDGENSRLIINVVSFGYKKGILLDADLVYDVRFLPNPYYNEELRPLNGQDQTIKDFVFASEESFKLMDLILEYLDFSIPYYKMEGKANLVVGIGCTGGKHRSVVIAEELTKELEKRGELVFLSHRDKRYWE